MLDKFSKRLDVEEAIEGKGDFVQIDYLNRFLKMFPPLDMRKFAYFRLAGIYHSKKMFRDSAGMYNNLATSCTTFADKRKYFVKQAEEFILGGFFEDANKAVQRAFGESNSREKKQIIDGIKMFYRTLAELYEKEMKKNKASTIYERLFRMNLEEQEKEDIRLKLIALYDRLGKAKEADLLRGD